MQRLLRESGDHRAPIIRDTLRKTMWEKVGLFRDEKGLTEALQKIRELKEKYKSIHVEDKSSVYNNALIHALELGNMLDLAEATTLAALMRKETRGGPLPSRLPRKGLRELDPAHGHVLSPRSAHSNLRERGDNHVQAGEEGVLGGWCV
ncbi:MAG: hypothetical protein ACTSUQ_11855 [Candidatus Freyarchaeota archaeon]